MKVRIALLVLALVVGGPVLAEQVHAASLGFVIFAWVLGISRRDRVS
jgi:hypothetical protein